MSSEPDGDLILIDPQPLLYQPTPLWWYKKQIYTGDEAMKNRLQEDAPADMMVVMLYNVWFWKIKKGEHGDQETNP